MRHRAILTVALGFCLLAAPQAFASTADDYSALYLCKPVPQQYYRDRERGWYFKEYCEPPSNEDSEDAEPQKSKKSSPELPPLDWAKMTDDSYLDSLTAKGFRELLDRAKEEVVYNPSREKLYTYLKMQDYMSNKAARFGHVWQDVLLEHPELNPTVKNPTSSFGVQVKAKYEASENKMMVAKIAEDTGIFLFVSGDCPYCHAEADIIARLEKLYGVEVRTISNDHCNYSGFHNCSVRPELFDVFTVKVTPTLVAVYRDSGNRPRYQPIATGILTLDEVVSRLIYYYNLHKNGQYPG